MATLTTLLGEKLLKNNQPVEFGTAELKQKTVGLYFAAQWCTQCRILTPKFVNAYNSALAKNDKLSFDVVFISADQDEKSFEEFFQEMPWKAIPFENREQIEGLNRQYQIQDIPSLIIVKANCELLTSEGTDELESPDAIEQWAKGEKVFWTREPQDANEHVWPNIRCNICYMKPLVGQRFGCLNRECGYDLCQKCHLIHNEQARHAHELIQFLSLNQTYSIKQMFLGGKLIDRNGEHVAIETLDNKYLGIYFSASWCPSNQSCTFDLVEVYQKAIEFGLPFDIVFVSGDDSQAAFDKQHEGMPWKILSFDNHITKLQLKTYFSVSIIPTLIVLKPSGEVLTKTGQHDIRVRDIEAVETWCKGEEVEYPTTTPKHFIWLFITCDGCGITPIIGQRFYCKTCSDYDLCALCKEKGHEHELILITQSDEEEEEKTTQ